MRVPPRECRVLVLTSVESLAGYRARVIKESRRTQPKIITKSSYFLRPDEVVLD